MGEISPLRLIV